MTSLGQALKDQREARNISLEEIAAATKIVPRYLEALEADRLNAMPGGFFIKGIIRSYAQAVGLDPDEVLGRYKAAGLISEPGHVPPAPLKRAAKAEPVVVQSILDPIAAEPAPPAGDEAAPPFLVEETPKPRLSPAARKHVFGVAWRLFAILAIIVVLIVIWSNRAPRQPESKPESIPVQVLLPPPQTSEPGISSRTETVQPGSGTAPGTTPAAEVTPPAAAPVPEPQAKPEAPPASEQVWKGITIEISFQAETWIHVQTDGQPKIDGIFPAGATATAQADRLLLIHTGNAGGFTFRLNGRPAKRLGRSGQVLTDVKITLENLKDFLEAPSLDPPTG